MNFVYPEILWALFALIIPILVHLFNFRKFRKVLFPNVAFLKEVKQETQSKSRIKHWLILASRMLALAALIFAFAQPYIPKEGSLATTGNKVVSLYIDNSFSMEAENQDGRLLDLAKNKALQIAEYYKATDKFQLITNDFEGRHQRFVSRDEVLDFIEEVEATSSVAQLSNVVSRQMDLVRSSEEDSKTLFLLSDWQKATHDFENLKGDTSVRIQLVPSLFEQRANVFVDSIWFDTPVRQINQPEVLNIRIRNTSDEIVKNVPVKLHINGVQRALGSFEVRPNEPSDTSLFFSHSEGGFKRAVLSLTDHPVTFDDKFYFSYHVAEKIPILEVKGRASGSRHFSKIFGEDDFFEFSSVSDVNLDYSTFSEFNCIILNDVAVLSSGLISELSRFIQNGGSLLVVPHTDIDIASYSALYSNCGAPSISDNRFATTKVSDINIEHPIFRDLFEEIPRNIDLPKVQAYYHTPKISKSNTDALLSLQNGDPFLSSTKFGKGKLYAFAVSLNPEASNLAEHAIFVASALRIAEFSAPTTPLYYTIGKDETVLISNLDLSGDQVFHVVDSLTGVDFLPGHRKIGGNTEIFMHSQMSDAGNYDLKSSLGTIATLGYNYSRLESNMSHYTKAEVDEMILGIGNVGILDADMQGLQKQVQELDEGVKLWYLLIIVALILLALEIVLIKVWK